MEPPLNFAPPSLGHPLISSQPNFLTEVRPFWGSSPSQQLPPPPLPLRPLPHKVLSELLVDKSGGSLMGLPPAAPQQH